jgi:hypothetical protein
LRYSFADDSGTEFASLVSYVSIEPAPTITLTEFFAEKTISGALIAQNIRIQDAFPEARDLDGSQLCKP